MLFALVPSVLTRLAERHPGLRVEIGHEEAGPAFAGLLAQDFDIVLVVRIPPNIEPLNADELAARAIASVPSKFGLDRKDGISYLIGAKEVGIKTPLRSDYESAILQRLDANSLEEARITAADAERGGLD